jgi:hypothetical protein
MKWQLDDSSNVFHRLVEAAPKPTPAELAKGVLSQPQHPR